MSIPVGFTTESKRENSTRQRTMSATHNCLFKNGCSMLYPTLLLELDTDVFPNYTGFKIENRYYNITDIKSVRQNLFEISGDVDVLATYKSEIGSATEYVVRAASASDPLVIDTLYPAKADTLLQSFSLHGLTVDNEGTYVVGVVGTGSDSSSMVTYYAFNAYTFSELCWALFDDNYLDGTLTDVTVDLQKELLNPFQYIASCVWYPIPYSYFTGLGTLATVYFGWWKAQYSLEGGLNTVVAIRIPEEARIYPYISAVNPPRHPQAASRGNFLNDIPYTRYTLNCHVFGSIPINPSPCANGGTYTIRIDVDVFANTAQLYIFHSEPGTGSELSCIYTSIAQFGAPIQISQNNANLSNTFTSAVAIGENLARGKLIGAANGISSAIQSLFPQLVTQGNNGSKAAYVQDPNLVAEFRSICEEDNTTMGRPLCAPRQINTLSGYIQCENVDIQLACTEPERIKVIDFMESGFFYE